MIKKSVFVTVLISLLFVSSFAIAIEVDNEQVKISFWQKVIDFFSGETPQDSPSPQLAKPIISIEGCQILDKMGTYYLLKKDIVTTDTCFEIRAHNITLDLNNHSITGDFSGVDFGVLIKYADSVIIKNGLIEKFDAGIRIDHANNNLIKNMILRRSTSGVSIWEGKNNLINNNSIKENYASGVYTSYSSGNIIRNNSFNKNTFAIQTFLTQNSIVNKNNIDQNNVGMWLVKSNNNSITSNTITYSKVKYGLYLEFSANNTLSENYIANNTDAGIFFADPDLGSNLIYNNYLKNKINVNYSSNSQALNFWNVTKTPGKNIVGGPFIAGNYWANLNGTGLSETCADVDNDGICEAQRKINDNNIDYLPLTI